MNAGTRTCLECGGSFTAHRNTHRFCSAKCRGAFHRRREKRGLALYDLAMVWRYDRTGEGPEAHKLLCRAAADFHADDQREREGRRSWLTVREMRADGMLAQLASVTTTTRMGRM